MELEDLRRAPTRTGRPGEASLEQAAWKFELPLGQLWETLKNCGTDDEPGYQP